MLVPAYRLAIVDGRVMGMTDDPSQGFAELTRVVFLMLNPSTANAFKVDPTVGKCVKFAQRWGAQVLEVVNLFALRSPYPADLYKRIDEEDPTFRNDFEILSACVGASRVIAAWGNHGALHGRAAAVTKLVTDAGVKLEHLGLTQTHAPLHPLARGKHFIPLDREPQPLVIS
jgi:hypothetical protein